MKLQLPEETYRTLKAHKLHPLFRLRDDGLFEHLNDSGQCTGLVVHGKLVRRHSSDDIPILVVGMYVVVSLYSDTLGDVLVSSTELSDVVPVGNTSDKIRYWLTTPTTALV